MQHLRKNKKGRLKQASSKQGAYICIVAPPVSAEWGLTGHQPLEGGCWERGSDFFQGGGVQFSHKNKLKSEIFNDKKIL